MPISHNGTTLTGIVFNGTTVTTVVFNGTTVFTSANRVWTRIDGTDSQGGFAADYNLTGDESNDADMIANCENNYQANSYPNATINYYNTAYGYYTLFQSL